MERLVAQLAQEIDQYLRPLTQGLQSLAKAIQPLAQGFVLYDEIAKASEASGWLPYRTVPFRQYFFECGGIMNAISEKIESYYENQSQEIIQDIESQLARYDIDREAKATFKEALRAHECALYRCACRVLLPEIERVIREDWLDVSSIATLKQEQIERAMNKKYLEDFVLKAPEDLVLFDQLATHLFKYVESHNQVLQETTPNRHAASHGWVSYSSKKNSLNTIICADYVFRLVTSFKGSGQEESTECS